MSNSLQELQELSLLKSATGGTSLVTIYISGSSNMTFVTGMICRELSTASNIKDKNVRKGVTTALKSCASYLKSYKYCVAPQNGLIMLSGEAECCV
jgi:peptide subunit release factor 1 (eRF1)